MFRSRVRTVFGATLLALVVSACGGGSPTDDDDNDCPGAPGCPGPIGGDPVVTTSVTVRDNNSFNPNYIRVSPGATVTWTWEGTTDEDHNVYFASAAIADSPDQRSGTFQATMPTQAGSYDYECQNHASMDGRVLVQ